jgi:hypothetical protein
LYVGEQKIKTIGLSDDAIKQFSVSFTMFQTNRLECFFLAKLSATVLYLRACPRAGTTTLSIMSYGTVKMCNPYNKNLF